MSNKNNLDPRRVAEWVKNSDRIKNQRLKRHTFHVKCNVNRAHYQAMENLLIDEIRLIRTA